MVAEQRAKRPLIGITPSDARRPGAVAPTPEGEPSRHEMALGLAYLHAIDHAGGLPVMMPPVKLHGIEALLEQLAGVCLPGGPDISPQTYGATSHPRLGPVEPAMDAFGLAVARLADLRQLPILAIGRGMQLMNVARGGTLHQHIPDIATTVKHRQHVAGDCPSHDVELESGSRLAQILKSNRLAVNSFHHQCVDQLGEQLHAGATAPDATIEGIEAEDRPFLVGVQWNAELLAGRDTERSLFEQFVAACNKAPLPTPA